MKTKLTLRIDENLVKRAKSHSRKAGKSVSQMVADYFALLAEEPSLEVSELSPLVRSLKGVLRGADVSEDSYRQHLEKKYL